MIRTKLFYLLGSLTLLLFAVLTWNTEAQEATNEVLPSRLEMLVYPPTEENSAEWAALLEAPLYQQSLDFGSCLPPASYHRCL